MVFETRYDYFENQIKFFGLSNPSANFQGYINKTLGSEKLEVFIIMDLDHILIYINKTNHVNSLLSVLKQLRKYFLYVNLKEY